MRRSVPIRLVTLGLILGQGAPLPALAAGAGDDRRPPRRKEEVKAKAPSPEKPKVAVNRTVPPTVPAPALPHFSSPPLDAEITRARIFDEPLIPADGARDAAEDSELARLIVETIQSKSPDSALKFEPFLSSHPDSRWNGSLLAGLGVVYRRTGYFTRALESWERSWSLLKNETDPRLRALADRAVGELAELNARLGRADRLESLFTEIEGRNVRGPASEKVIAARQGYWMMQNQPEVAFLCGPFGLARILASVRPGYVTDPKIAAAKSTRQGTSIVQMLQLADSVGLKMQIARRTPGAAVLVPALVHWKAGHFAALIKESAGRLLIQDPTFGGDLWISRAALESEASGYFLVPAGELRQGWQGVAKADAGGVWGKGQVTALQNQVYGKPGPPPSGQVSTGGPGGKSCKGMATYTVNLLLMNLHISDTPVGYSPAIGPSMQFTVFYNLREIFQPQIPIYSNLGPKWTFDWFAFTQDNPNDNAADVGVYLRGGGMETYSGMGSGTSQVQYRSRAVLVRTSSSSYERRLADGSVEVFGQSDGSPNSPRRIYMTQYTDPQGNRVLFNYSYNTPGGGYRLESVVDALQPIGQVTTLSYEDADPFKITKVTDPFGRFATFSYDSSGRLQRITDVMGITSEVGYGDSDYVFALTTPYGTTGFVTQNIGGFPWLEITDPLGGKEHFEFNPGIGFVPGVEPVPAGMGTEPSLNGYRNTYFWDKKAMAGMSSLDYAKARIYHWEHSIELPSTASGTLESEKLPLENRVWYNYPDQIFGTAKEGSAITPTAIGRVLDDGSTQLTLFEYNTRGMKTREIDPVGRETVYVYGTNNVPDPDPATGTGIDLLQVKVKNIASPGGWDVTAGYSYNAEHQPLTVTDAAGQTTTYTYDSDHRVETVTTPPRSGITEERTTTYAYDPVTGNVANVTAPGGVDTSYTYDAYGRLRTTTDNDNYILTYDYDDLDRQTKVTYPDGTYEETVYERMDPTRRRDRLGRWTHTFYDALRRPFATRDPEGRVVTQQWCSCGSLDKLIDANGNATTWTRDVQDRVRFETRANGSAKEFVYETTTSRLSYVKDAKLQEIHYTYGPDDKLLQTSYVNAEHPTPSVTFNYTDPATSAPDAHGRLRQIVDGAGTTSYAYQPITGSPSLGAGQLASVDGPLDNDTITYGYDELGRVVSRTLNSITSSWSYDQEGRLQSQGDPIGTFTYGYMSNSGRVQTLTYPNGQTTSYAYYPVAQDLRLQEIHHKKPNTTTLNKFNYTYDALGNIQTWTQQTDTSPANAYDFGYDRVDQLRVATYRTTDPTPTILKRYRYAYDPAGNRTAEQIDDVVTGASHDNMNRLTSQQPGGALLFSGTVSEPATVTVGDKPATVSPTNQFSATLPVPANTSQVAVQATDSSGNVRTNTYEVSQSGSSKSFTYDPNGNLTGDGTKTYEWDAENRLTAVNQGTLKSEFSYDGNGRRVRVVEKNNAVITADRHFVLTGPVSIEERDGAGAVVKRFSANGFQQSGTSFYLVRDQLGSVTDVTDNTGALRARYSYDPYGRQTKISGDVDADFGYTGHFSHVSSGLALAPYRAYAAAVGRWISEDGIGPESGDPNLYRYVAGNPARYFDPEGLTLSSNATFFWEWVFEQGAGQRQYGQGSVELQEMSTSPGAAKMRAAFKAGNCCNIYNGSFGTIEAYFKTAWMPQSTAFQVGGFVYDAVNNGNGTVMYTIRNQASAYSFFLHIPFIPHKQRGGTIHLMGNIDQTFQWTEQSPCSCL